jgi:hypothetical protein
MTLQGAIFELKIGNSGRLWLCRNKAEQQAWIQAINDAMVNNTGRPTTQGSPHGRSGTVNSRSPFRDDLKACLKVKGSIRKAETTKDYVTAIGSLLGRAPLDVPVGWIMQQVDNPTSGRTATNQASPVGAFVESSGSGGIEQLWKDLSRDTIRINRELFCGDSGHGPEKMIGA